MLDPKYKVFVLSACGGCLIIEILIYVTFNFQCQLSVFAKFANVINCPGLMFG